MLDMRRREFITMLGGAAVAWPLGARAQQSAKIYRIFWASTESEPDPFVDGFRDGLKERGYIEGKNVVLSLRYAPGNPDALRPMMSELTRDKVDLAVSSGPAIRAMKAATNIPVLFAISGDPVELGLVKSLARPGGNFTGSTDSIVSNLNSTAAVRRLLQQYQRVL
jgi:putative ABC transport system substrate-binding protein